MIHDRESTDRIVCATAAMTDTRFPTWDPLGYDTPLPLERTFFPLGFPLDIRTNSAEVLAAAETSWPERAGAFSEPRLRLQVLAEAGDDHPPPPPPRYRAQGKVLCLAADSRHLAACDLERAKAVCWVSAALAANRTPFRYHYLEGIVYCLLSYLRLTPVHASCVASGGRGVLLSGPPGTGKSCLAYACAKAGLTFVSDDVGYLLRADPGSRLLGRPHFLRLRPSALALFRELQGTPVGADVGGEPIIEIRLDGLEGMTTAPGCVATAVVFLERRPDSPAVLSGVDAPAALDLLVRELPVASEAVNREQVASIERLVRRGAYRLTYSGLPTAVDRIRELLESIARA